VKYFERRPFPPGVHGRARRKMSDYSVRLREKQRLRHQYNIGEAQLRRIYHGAQRHAGKSGERLVVELECRLDALVLRSGLARTVYQARQMVSHGHLTVDDQKVNIPSYRVKPYQRVAVRERSRSLPPFLVAAAGGNAPAVSAPYLDVSLPGLTFTLIREPQRAEIPVVCDEQLVVEFYSR
jgi:small subunit ribosomal protein S4